MCRRVCKTVCRQYSGCYQNPTHTCASPGARSVRRCSFRYNLIPSKVGVKDNRAIFTDILHFARESSPQRRQRAIDDQRV
jgi:hypothetical protein